MDIGALVDANAKWEPIDCRYKVLWVKIEKKSFLLQPGAILYVWCYPWLVAIA